VLAQKVLQYLGSVAQFYGAGHGRARDTLFDQCHARHSGGVGAAITGADGARGGVVIAGRVPYLSQRPHVDTRPHRSAVQIHILRVFALHLVAVATVHGHDDVRSCGPAEEGIVVQWLWRVHDCHAKVLPSGDRALITNRV